MHSPGPGNRFCALAAATFVLVGAIESGCAGYKQDTSATGSIYDVRVTTSPALVASCRSLGGVDSRETSNCGLTVQPTPEECLRYQVRRAGGDTLLINGPIGEAYDCSGHAVGDGDPAPSRRRRQRRPREESRPNPAPAAGAPASAPPQADTPPESAVRITREREMAKGCIYLGDADPSGTCTESNGAATGSCADQARKAGGNLILRDGERSQIFSCRTKP